MAIDEEHLKVVARSFKPSTDEAMVYATWRNSLWFDQKRDAKEANKFFRKASASIKKILKDPNVKVRIACLKEDLDMIVGYAVLTKSNVEWVYIKPEYRNKGIARALVKEFETISRPETKIGKAIQNKKNLKEKSDGREDRQKDQII